MIYYFYCSPITVEYVVKSRGLIDVLFISEHDEIKIFKFKGKR